MVLWGLEEGEGPLLHCLLAVLRVPGLLLLDLWWTDYAPAVLPEALELEAVGEAGIALLLLLLALALLLLPLHELVQVYLHMIAAGAVAVGSVIATQFLAEEASREREAGGSEGTLDLASLADLARRHLCPIASYVTLTSVAAWCLGLSDPVLSRSFPSCYTAPLLLRLLGGSLPTVQWLTRVTSGLLVLASTLYVGRLAGGAFTYLRSTWAVYSFLREAEGSLTLLLLAARRLLEPAVLVLYWAVLFSSQLWSNYMLLQEKKYSIEDADWMIKGLVAMTEICESPLVLIATCLLLMMVSHGLLLLTRRLLALSGGPAGAAGPIGQGGLTEGLVAFVLALQTGLIDIEMPARIGAFSIILFVVTASLLQSCLDTVQPVLLSLPAASRRPGRHLPALGLGLLILGLPLLMVHGLLTRVSSDLWTLVIISSCLVTAVQAVGCLLTYLLFVWDSNLATPSPHVDDYVYYVKAGTRTTELLLAVAVVGCGFYESLVDSREWSVVNSLVLLTHCYFNIYSRISQGWASYLARRHTSQRLAELGEAAPAELAALADVCAICYQEMEGGAVRTGCRHYFHTHCLRRWLVVQDNCPMCTQPIVAKKEEPEEPEEEEAAEETEEELAVTDEEEERVDQAAPDGGSESLEQEPAGLRQRAGAVAAGGPVSHLFDGD